jgi:hypothetical protein
VALALFAPEVNFGLMYTGPGRVPPQLIAANRALVATSAGAAGAKLAAVPSTLPSLATGSPGLSSINNPMYNLFAGLNNSYRPYFSGTAYFSGTEGKEGLTAGLTEGLTEGFDRGSRVAWLASGAAGSGQRGWAVTAGRLQLAARALPIQQAY